ncbi:hypothetical protein FSP39_004001 [Pinctada imbricata]|uniref:C3H1-type domain-containing protein n=1 Tax=Pinctada imbricata TaxID=66713 RepID=A0AA88YMR9_PINIB|nr:hypothetical protein FSP39_004001 [Pinctada imbricata]
MHFVQKGDCSDITDDLENILKGNGKVFRLLEDPNICFVIAYLYDAEICDNYNQASLGRRCKDTSCWKFHICSLYVKGMCKEPHCKLSHAYGDEHNKTVKDRLRLSSYSDIDINKIILNCYPKICSTAGCDTEANCPFLHICSKFCVGICQYGSTCRLKHTFRTEHNVWILNAYNISENDISTGSPLARKLTIAKNT